MKTGDWVKTPIGIGVIGHVTPDTKNAYICGYLAGDMYAFAVELLEPLDPAVVDILRSVNEKG